MLHEFDFKNRLTTDEEVAFLHSLGSLTAIYENVLSWYSVFPPLKNTVTSLVVVDLRT